MVSDRNPQERVSKLDRRLPHWRTSPDQIGWTASSPRRARRYPRDLTDEEWALLEPLLPQPRNTGPTGGGPRAAPLQVILNAILHRCGPAAPGGSCPPTSRRIKASTGTSQPGGPTAWSIR